MGRANPDTDESLATAAAAGSRSAFERLVDRYGGRVVSVLEYRLGDHHVALDLAQEVWVRVFHALPRFRAGNNFRSWLFAIALNAARDEGRRRRRSRVVYLDREDDVFESTLAPTKPFEQAAIDAAIELVPEPYRTALVLVDVEGMTYEHAADCAECALGTMKSRVSRGRTAFREHWTRIVDEGSPATETSGAT